MESEENLELAERNGSLYLNGKLLAVKADIEKYGLPAVELALLRRTENVSLALDLLQEASVLLKKGPVKVDGVSFLEGSQVRQRQQEFVHYGLPLADDKGKRHELELVKFGKTIYGIFVDGKIVATNGMSEEPKKLVTEILGLAGKSLNAAEVARLNSTLAQVASIKSSRDYVIVTVAG